MQLGPKSMALTTQDAPDATFPPPAGATLSVTDRENLIVMVAPLMLFAIVWSVGASCDKNGRVMFDEFFRGQVGAGLPTWIMVARVQAC